MKKEYRDELVNNIQTPNELTSINDLTPGNGLSGAPHAVYVRARAKKLTEKKNDERSRT